MKRFISLVFAAINCVVMVYGQLVPVQNIQSPEVANLGLYGQIPVSLYTGTPDISIPLYELKAGSYTLPISMSYHLASVQPNKQYGVLGMGWNLIAGGYISRIANFIYDEKQNKNGDKYGYYYHHDKMQSVTTNGANYDNLVNNSINGNAYDLCADEFYFNFCGYSGHFYLCPDGNWKVVSEQDIKLEFDANNGGLIESSRLETEEYFFHGKPFSRLKAYRWNKTRKAENGWYFNKFTLVTPDGSRYEFGGLFATEYSISYYNPNNSDLIPTTWRLAKITTPDHRVIQFDYKKDFWYGTPMQCEIQYVPTRSYGTYVANYARGWEGFTGYLTFPSVLESISAGDEKITFNIEKDLRYNHMFDNAQVFYRGINHNIFSPYASSKYGYEPDDYNHNLSSPYTSSKDGYDPDNQYDAFININSGAYENDETIGQKIKNRLSSYYVKGITIDTGFGEDSVQIKFSYLDRKRKMLDKVTISGKAFDDSYTSKSYSFDYIEPEMFPDNFVFPETDSWGYYLGGKISLSKVPDFNFKAPSLLYTKVGVLKSITYPTGGKTVFDYELNDYRQSIDLYDRTILSDFNIDNNLNSDGITSSKHKTYPAGGLRIKQIQSLDFDGKVLNTKKYYYTTTKDGNTSSGILSVVPCNHITYRFGSAFMQVESMGGFWPSTLGNNTPVVGYSTVFEETFDNDNNSLGYIKKCFSNYDNDIYGERHLDENCLYTNFGDNGTNYHYTNRSVERGKLLSESFYDNFDNLQRKINYRYKTTVQNYFLISNQDIVDINDKDIHVLGWLNKIYTYDYLMQSETDTTYIRPLEANLTTRKEYTYNSSNLPSTISELCSDGSIMKTSYLYPTDKTEYSWMVDKHNISSAIEKSTSYRGKTKTEKYDYSKTEDTNVPYLKKVSTSYNGLDFKTDYETVLVDKYGNPIEIVANGLKSLLYWGINGQLLNVRIDNFSNEQAISLGMMNALEYSNDDMYCPEVFYEKFFKLPASAHMYVYYYERRRLLESITEPTGFTTYFKFDGLNRLREVYHYDYEKPDIFTKRFMHLYDYHYIDQHQENE